MQNTSDIIRGNVRKQTCCRVFLCKYEQVPIIYETQMHHTADSNAPYSYAANFQLADDMISKLLSQTDGNAKFKKRIKEFEVKVKNTVSPNNTKKKSKHGIAGTWGRFILFVSVCPSDPRVCLLHRPQRSGFFNHACPACTPLQNFNRRTPKSDAG